MYKQAYEYSTKLVINNLNKAAALGWEPEGTNITHRFKWLPASIVGEATSNLKDGQYMDLLLKQDPYPVEDLPDFDPRTGAYIGKSYIVPKKEEELQKLHKLIVGKTWEDRSPRIFRWLLAPRNQRIKQSIIKAIATGDADRSKLSTGELASLAFPRILKQDGSITSSLGVLRPYPIHYGLTERPITNKDIQKYIEHSRK